MWGFTSDRTVASKVTPLLAAALADRGAAVATPAAGSSLLQPEGAPALPAGGLPAGFFAGKVCG
jgi:hypothetical protein